MTITFSISGVLEGASAPTLPARVTAPADGVLVVDGTRLDLSLAPVGAKLHVDLDAAADGSCYAELERTDDGYEAVVHSRVSEDPPAPWNTTVELDTFPAYPLWPAGETETAQDVTTTVDGAADRRAAIRARIAIVADHYDHDHLHDDPDDPGDKRQSNVANMARSVIGWAWWLTKCWESGIAFGGGGTPEPAEAVAAEAGVTIASWEDLADWAASELERRIEQPNSVKQFYWGHDPSEWDTWFSADVPAVRLPLADFSGVVVHNPSSAIAWGDLTGSLYVEAQKASVGLS